MRAAAGLSASGSLARLPVHRFNLKLLVLSRPRIWAGGGLLVPKQGTARPMRLGLGRKIELAAGEPP